MTLCCQTNGERPWRKIDLEMLALTWRGNATSVWQNRNGGQHHACCIPHSTQNVYWFNDICRNICLCIIHRQNTTPHSFKEFLRLIYAFWRSTFSVGDVENLWVITVSVATIWWPAWVAIFSRQNWISPIISSIDATTADRNFFGSTEISESVGKSVGLTSF